MYGTSLGVGHCSLKQFQHHAICGEINLCEYSSNPTDRFWVLGNDGGRDVDEELYACPQNVAWLGNQLCCSVEM